MVQNILLTLGVFAVCLLIMGIGALLKGRCLRGSCGGEPVRLGDERLSCSNCPNRSDDCSSDASRSAAQTADANQPV